MPEHKMVLIDGIRYRPEEAPQHRAVAEPKPPVDKRPAVKAPAPKKAAGDDA